ncbi:amidohydrolase [Cumulibacter manganitolerans]|uniref:amidohydrolase n=1 Tax=Cumulibacter manganitolerans TaxID=1884992 RepID=UPI001E455283|nr:amidohydrolase family protein [Cumulibacter manganitolerans]
MTTRRLLIRNARIVGADVRTTDVVIDGGVLGPVGDAGPQPGVTDAFDAAGGWLMPGLWDKHVHLGQWAMAGRRLDLSGTSSPDEVLQRVGAAGGGGRVLVGFGYRLAAWAERPGVRALDRVSGERPVVLISGDAHNAWLNSRALELAGLPWRDDVVAEREWFDAYPRIGAALELAPTTEDYADAITAAHRLGVTGVVDLEFERGFEHWARRAPGLPPLRVRTGVYPDDLDAAVAAGLRTGDPLGGLATMGPLKVIVDGSLGTGTAYCCEPYADGPTSALADHPTSGVGDGSTSALADHPTSGVVNYGPDELAALMRRADGAGLAVALHAIGDAALDAVLSAFEQTGARGSVEHAQLARREDLPRLARLGLVASVQPAHLLDDRAVADACWADRTDRCFMLRSMIDAGVPLALGSDAPVAPLDPWLAIDAASRRCADGDEPWHPAESITRREALLASVDGRRVAPGEPADLVLLEDDPVRVSRPRVAATWVAGERVYTA